MEGTRKRKRITETETENSGRKRKPIQAEKGPGVKPKVEDPGYDPLRADKIRLVNDTTSEEQKRINEASMRIMQKVFGPNGGRNVLVVKIV